MKQERTRKTPNVWQACVILVCVIAAVVAAIKTGVGIQMGLAMGACIAIVFALLLGNKWSDIQQAVCIQLHNDLDHFVVRRDLGYRQQGLSGPVSGGVSKAAGAG